MSIIRYEHHGHQVYVQEELKGKHKEHCLCYQGCRLFKPGTKDNCIIAGNLFIIDQHFGLVTPVWECPRFDGRPEEDMVNLEEYGRDGKAEGDNISG